MFKAILRHKALIFLVLAALGGGGYYAYVRWGRPPVATTYTLSAATKNTVISTVGGTGQVSSSNQVDIQPKASGDVVYVGVTAGQQVKAGTVLVRLDDTAAQKTVRDARTSLQSAQLALDKLMQPPDQLSVTQAQDALAQAQESRQSAQDDLQKTYDNGFSEVSNSFIDLPAVMTGLYNVLYSSDVSKGVQSNLDYYADTVRVYDDQATKYRDDADAAYQRSRVLYDANFADYKAASRFAGEASVSRLIDETYATAKSITEAVKDASNLIQFYEDRLTEHGLKPVAAADAYLSDLSDYTGKTNSHLVNLLSAQQTIQNDTTAIAAADRTITEKTQSLAKLQAGADPLDIQSQKLAIQQKQNSLQDALDNLANFTVRAPFAGIAAAVNVQKGDSASSGTAVVTLIANQQVAEISLNEVDVAKIKLGQKATLTLDAVPDLSITGHMNQIDTIGTVSQGVVTYNVKIVFDTQDNRVKPGMSVSAAIITDVLADVLTVPNAAVKTANGASYVLMLDNVPAGETSVTTTVQPRRQTVVTGAADDTQTQITSGLNEGDLVVTRSSSNTAASSAASSAASRVGIPGLGGGGIRIPGAGGRGD